VRASLRSSAALPARCANARARVPGAIIERMRAYAWAALFVGAIAGCQAHPPAHWAQGGSRLDIPRARWNLGDGVVDVMPDGKVLVDGSHMFTIDIAGRVFDVENDAIALLEPDGRLVGKDETSLGQVGLRNASPPGVQFAWLTIDDHGTVVRFDPEGGPHPAGTWSGCGPALRTCTLVTHVMALQQARGPRGSRVRFGLGMGVGTGVGTGFGMFVMP
jgi:hypothetical protein